MSELKEYQKKRDFTRTPEPSGIEKENRQEEPLRFVVHKHQASHLHWDLRLELDGVLKSWAIPKGPSLDPEEKKLAVMVEDHPIDYQHFEGVIPEGNYGAGNVMIWDRGTYHAAGFPGRRSSEEALRKGLDKGHLSFVLEGERLNGEFALVKLKRGKENSWLLIKKRDEFARRDGLAGADTSVVSGRSMKEIERNLPDAGQIDLTGAIAAPMPLNVRPMLAVLIEKPFDRSGWLFEIKWDGYRALAQVQKGKVRLYTRNDKTLNQQFPPVVATLKSLPFEALLDGEVVVTDESGKASFQLLQNYLRSNRGNLVYYVFDLLHFNGYDVRKLPLVRRKSILRQILSGLPNVKFSDHVESEGLSLFEQARKHDVEGIIAKDGQSPYRTGQRSRDWLKIKTHHTQEAVIGGFTEPRGGRKGFGSLVLGVYENEKLVYIGHTGGGFTDEQLQSLHRQLDPLEVGKSPFVPPPKTNTPVTWVAPKLVCEVRFAGWTDEGFMRQPVFLGLREDIDPREARREEPERIAAGPDPREHQKLYRGPRSSKKGADLVVINDAKVPLTNLEKVFWPQEGYTKGDVIDYYREVAPFILPYLKDRPESLHRHPDGIAGESFFQKNVDHTVPDWIHTIAIRSESENRELNYLLCQDQAALVYLANLGCIEINPWHSRIRSLDAPDYMVLDLDPFDAPFMEVIRAATVIHEVLQEIGVEGFCKTSGATGLHVYVPLGANYSHDQSVQFARLISLLVHTRLPRTTSVERNPDKRRGKIYLDFMQNARGRTLVAPYCIRPRKGAPVSTPLQWEEVGPHLDPARFTIKTIMNRLCETGDLWKGVLGMGIHMDQCLQRIEELMKG
ncbi:MAG: putative DNA ligase-like protein [Syntrophorhabdaceae bacterium PtaU1.Bin034]|nr:MAG: putative DNA ligase-like protein [Syntrophorhabdaceae bacterium PtaU1.Bin034]